MNTLGLNPAAELRRHAVEHADLVLEVAAEAAADPRPDAATVAPLRRPVAACAPATC